MPNELELSEIEAVTLIKNLKEGDFLEKKNEDISETFFKQIAKNLNDPENISTKTEYTSIEENFTGTKLEFLALYGNMPYLKKWITLFETKRISLLRKGRLENIEILKKRDEEIQKDKEKNMLSKLGMGIQ